MFRGVLIICVCITVYSSASSTDTVVPETTDASVTQLVDTKASYDADDVDPTNGYPDYPIDDSEDYHPGCSDGPCEDTGDTTDNSDGLNKLVGDGPTSIQGATGVNSPGYSTGDTDMDANGHYYLGPSRRRVGAGFGRRRAPAMAVDPDVPTPEPTAAADTPTPEPTSESEEEKAIDDLVGPTPEPTAADPIVKELTDSVAEPTPEPTPVPETLPPTAPPTPFPTPVPDVPTPPPTPEPTPEPYTLKIRVTTGTEDYADSDAKPQVIITGTLGEYTGSFTTGNAKGAVQTTTFTGLDDIGEPTHVHFNADNGNGWLFEKIEVKSGTAEWMNFGCTHAWLDAEIDKDPYSGPYATEFDLHPIELPCSKQYPEDWGAKTHTGCFCSMSGDEGSCGNHGSSYPWCRTRDSCEGHSGSGGAWDKCDL